MWWQGGWLPYADPPRDARGRLELLRSLWDRLHEDESHSRISRTRAPDPGFAEAAWRWARGEKLERVLERAQLAPGDFVRNSKQLVDLLSQIAVVAPSKHTAHAAARACDQIRRGVVATSLWPASEALSAPEDEGSGGPEGGAETGA